MKKRMDLAPSLATPATIEEAAGIALDGVSVTYGNGSASLTALHEASFAAPPGSFTALVGPSGCGKSTILKLVAGLLRPSAGAVAVAGRPVGDPSVRTGVAFQNATLMPWLKLRANVMLPLKIVPPFRARWPAERQGAFAARADVLLARVGLGGFGESYPWQLSGGMLQRASLCRALIHDPTLLLLDEPFGALDAFTREELWALLQDLFIDRRPTVLMVTHDLREAAFLADRIVVMSARPGRIIADEAVPFARPRTTALTWSAEFAALTGRLHGLITAARAEAA